MSVELILASGSPRRKALLAQVGLFPKVCASSIDESVLANESASSYVLRVAKEKALAYQRKFGVKEAILAADTVVALDGECLHKTADRSQIASNLAKLSGQTHLVMTAVALRLPDERMISFMESTMVRFRQLSSMEIEKYIESGEASDKAGSYGIQGLGGGFVASIHGSYTNVVGLPLEETFELLKQEGLT